MEYKYLAKKKRNYQNLFKKKNKLTLIGRDKFGRVKRRYTSEAIAIVTTIVSANAEKLINDSISPKNTNIIDNKPINKSDGNGVKYFILIIANSSGNCPSL